MNEIFKAAESLTGHWHQGDYSDGRGNFCGIGHLYAANTSLTPAQIADDPDHELLMTDEDLSVRLNQACKLLNTVAVEQYPDRTTEFFADFNDHPDTTEADVLMVMEKAAVRWDEMN